MNVSCRDLTTSSKAVFSVSKAKHAAAGWACTVVAIAAVIAGFTTAAHAESSRASATNPVLAATNKPSIRGFAVRVTYDDRTEVASSVKAHVVDSFDFVLPWPIPALDSVKLRQLELKFQNYPSKVIDVRDLRKGCVAPEVPAGFERMEVTRVLLTGSLINVEGRQTVLDSRVVGGKGSCVEIGQIRPGASNIDFVAAFLPPQVFADTPPTQPLVAKGIGTGGAWTWTFTPQ